MNISPKQRNRARRFAIQAIYQWQLAGGQLADIKAQFIATNDYLRVDWPYFSRLVENVLKNLNELDAMINPLMAKGEDTLKPVEKAILRLGTSELKYCIDVPFQVVIAEYVELDFEFGAEEGHKLVNGILDKLSAVLRAAEYQAK